METKILSTSEYDIALAGEIIKSGGLVAFPTETVYGLGADALNEEAVKKIYIAKGRPSDNPLIVHIAEKEDIIPLVKEVTPAAKALIDKFFPAPLTIILQKSEWIGNTVSGGLDTVAVRMPQNETARALIRAAGTPIAAPSANTSGLPSPTKAKHVIDDMNGKIDAIICGEDCDFGVESTVITLATEIPTILRPGAITKEMLEDVIGKVDVAKAVLEGMGQNEVAASPGMKYKHYAPKAKVLLVNASKEKYEAFVNSKKDAFALCFEEDNITIPKVTFGKESDDCSQAKELFDALRQLDEMGAKKVYARIPHKNGVGMAVYNRLIRAAAFCIIDLEKPFIIGLTGQTGAGKGYVGSYLKSLGFNVLDTDIYSRKICEKNSPFLTVLAEQFGNDIIENGILNRQLLADRAFSSPKSTEKLNSILHPAILELCKKDSVFPSVLDAPLLFECGGNEMCYKSIAVLAPREIRLNRIVERDGITKEQALARINAQKDEEFYKTNSDFTVINDGRDIENQINKILEEIL
ncbi:MAG: threonylcarbamoyl-AMP synthase [Eubacterium sp.]|nr:threonylcarbamoyl-AMP synthase [Eubacterium sp.]